ncbi:hypothetical protein WJX73_007423 [Symbiochloris irregularis]|uniref:Uncharacterized protein n=1 Tax=Symbiochloris irregularis TaxID=706552 RepID=A0AAW1PC15_9CHLO
MKSFQRTVVLFAVLRSKCVTAWEKMEDRFKFGRQYHNWVNLSLRTSQVEDDAALLAKEEVSNILEQHLQKRGLALEPRKGKPHNKDDPSRSDAECWRT